MKTKLLSILMAALVGCQFASAQSWVKKGAGLSANGVCVVDLSVPSDNVAWGILAVFSAGSCGGAVPYFTKTINGNNWAAGTIPLPSNHTPISISAVSGTVAWIAASDISTNTAGMVYKTSNGGGTWVQQTSANFTDAAKFIHFYNANEGVVIGDSSVYTTVDGGANWVFNSSLANAISNLGMGATNFLLNASDFLGDKIWLGDTYGNFFKSNDRGLTWTLLPQSINPSGVKGISMRDSLYGIAVASYYVSGGGIGSGSYADNSVYTTDGGLTWTLFSFNFYSPNVVNSVAKYDVTYVPGTPNTFIACSEYDASYAAFTAISTDGGQNWEMMDSTEQHTVCVFTSPTNGYTGGYIPDFQSGIYKWNGALPLGIEKANLTEKISIWPQPTSGLMNVDLTAISELEPYMYQVVDLTGHEVLSNPVAENSLQIDMSNYAKGVYILKLLGKNAVLSRKIVR